MTLRARWIAGGVVVGAIAAVVGWRIRDHRDHARPRAERGARLAPPGLDPRAFRAQRAATLERARKIAARPTTSSPPASPATATVRSAGRWPMQGLGALPDAGAKLLAPCILGPPDLCATLAEHVAECDGGDALACMAVGELLADTPPRPLIAHTFFYQACRIGDPAGCARYADLKPPSNVACVDDPFACGWRAYRSRDAALHEEACSLGVADSCVELAEIAKADPERSRAYLETACQLGHPMACMELGRRLTPGCIASADRVCYPADAAQAKAALAIACDCGITEACEPAG